MNIAAPASRQPDRSTAVPFWFHGGRGAPSDAVGLVICATIVREGSLDASRAMVGSHSDATTDAAIKEAAFDIAADGAHRTVAAGVIAATAGPT
jgi:hypothetical protein